MVRVRTSKAKRDGAVQRIRRGETTIEAEARKLKVQPRAVKAWVTMAKRGTKAGRPKSGDRHVAREPLAHEATDSAAPRGSRLRSALAAAGLEDGEPIDDDRDDDAIDGPPIDGLASSVAPPTPEQLVAMTETIRGMGLRIYAGIVRVDTKDPRAAALFSLTKDERETLMVWAPWACRYVPALVSNSEQVGAWIYVGITAASLWTAMGELRTIAKVERARDPREGFRGPGDPRPRPPIERTDAQGNPIDPYPAAAMAATPTSDPALPRLD